MKPTARITMLFGWAAYQEKGHTTMRSTMWYGWLVYHHETQVDMLKCCSWIRVPRLDMLDIYRSPFNKRLFCTPTHTHTHNTPDDLTLALNAAAAAALAADRAGGPGGPASSPPASSPLPPLLGVHVWKPGLTFLPLLSGSCNKDSSGPSAGDTPL